MRNLLAALFVVGASGCADVDVDSNEKSPVAPGPTVEFDPANAIIPFPNNLLLCPASGQSSTGSACSPGRVFIPPTACETPAQTALRVNTLNTLNGFGTYEAAEQVTLTVPVDPSTLDGNVLLFQRTRGGVALDPTTAAAIPAHIAPSTTLRFTEGMCSTPATVDAVTIIPLVPLEQNSTYVAVVTSGMKTADAADFAPSFTWALVNQQDPPVVLDGDGNVIINRTPLNPFGGADSNHNGIPDLQELQGLAALWAAEAPALDFLTSTGQIDRSAILVAFDFTTQTTIDAVDPAVATGPAGKLGMTPLVGTSSIVCDTSTAAAGTCPHGFDRSSIPYNQCPGSDTNTQCFLKIALGSASCAGACSPVGTAAGTIYGTGAAVCAQVGCPAIADILAAGLATTNYQVATPNPLPGGAAIPGPWTDPYSPTAQGDAILQVLIFIPATAPTGPNNTFETLVFGHDITSSKNALFALAPQLAASPLHYASVAIDFVGHGSRAVQISNDAALGCASATLDPTVTPQCFEPFLSTDLATTRDSIRQTVLDLDRLVYAVKACGATGCASANSASSLKVDGDHLVYAGQGLGGIVGTMSSAMNPAVQSAVLNVSAVGWLDILEHTDTLALRCALVDALIGAGVLVGDKWNGSTTNPTGLCAGQSWQAQPGYQQFALSARWVLDPGEPANFMSRLVAKTFLLQEVVGDTVIPNLATDRMGMLGGLAPSSAIIDRSVWVRYTDRPPDPSRGFPGNTFAHASLLRPADGTAAGALGTASLQTDAITFLTLNHGAQR